jgi:hypothetical protein
MGGGGGAEEFSNYDLVSMRLDLKCASCDRPMIKSGVGGMGAAGVNQWCKGCKQFTQKCAICEQVRHQPILSHSLSSLTLSLLSHTVSLDLS